MATATAGSIASRARVPCSIHGDSRARKRPENFIFVRDQGAAWDVFTIGVYRDLKHYAESADILVQQQEEAAKKAGFDSASAIGPYLRTLIRTHHDTLAVAVK